VLTRGDLLIVDDDPKITSLLRRALIAEGYEVRTASNGSEGLARVRERQPDLVVLDVLMPGIDGLEVCQRLREESDIPILILTAKDETQDRVEGLDSGADDYLVKPFELDELLARVRALLRRRESREVRVLRFADLALDEALVHTARRAAEQLLDRHPDVATKHVVRWLGGRAEYLKA
jgi:two-component system, OmpR family, response regulator MprA